jgi:multidrug efflux pump subunit AcrA (membrane-fusion protein)
LVILAVVLFSACKKQPEKTQPTEEPISESVYASGIIKSKNQYQVYATVGGLLQKILVKEGDVVKAGDPLFVVQHESSKLNAENAQLAADYARSNVGGDRLNELKTAIETARSKMLNDSVLLTRQRGLWAQQIGSKVELEQRELAYTSSTASYQSAIFRYNDLQKQLKFAAAQSQKLLNISKNQTEDFVIRSQTAGRVYSIAKEVGEMVNAQSPLAVIGDAVTFEAELQVDENDIARIKNGLRVLLSMDSYKGQVFEAVIAKIDPIMNERSRTFTVDANFTQKPPVLYPNLTAEANIVIQSKEKALTIPRTYLVADSLVIMADNKPRRVTIGLKDYQKAEILSGLEAHETILKPGQ